HDTNEIAREELLEKSHHVTVQGFRFDLVALCKRFAQFTDTPRLIDQVPDFAADMVEPEIGTGALAQHDHLAVHLGGDGLTVLHNEAVGGYSHAAARTVSHRV